MHRVRPVVIAAFLALVLNVAPQAADLTTWSVTTSAGQVLVSGDGIERVSLRQGQEVAPGSRIRTLDDGRAVLQRGTDVITLRPNTEIVIPAAQPEFATRLIQTIGDAIYEVTRGPAPHFEVDTPYLAAVVKGTRFAVSSDSSGSSVHVLDGRVLVRNVGDGSSAMVETGRTGHVRPIPGYGVQIDSRIGGGTGNDRSGPGNAGRSGGGGEP